MCTNTSPPPPCPAAAGRRSQEPAPLSRASSGHESTFSLDLNSRQLRTPGAEKTHELPRGFGEGGPGSRSPLGDKGGRQLHELVYCESASSSGSEDEEDGLEEEDGEGVEVVVVGGPLLRGPGEEGGGGKERSRAAGAVAEAFLKAGALGGLGRELVPPGAATAAEKLQQGRGAGSRKALQVGELAAGDEEGAGGEVGGGFMPAAY